MYKVGDRVRIKTKYELLKDIPDIKESLNFKEEWIYNTENKIFTIIAKSDYFYTIEVNNEGFNIPERAIAGYDFDFCEELLASDNGENWLKACFMAYVPQSIFPYRVVDIRLLDDIHKGHPLTLYSYKYAKPIEKVEKAENWNEGGN